MEFWLITNNEKVNDAYADQCDVLFVVGTDRDVMRKVRDLVHEGYSLLTHPLSGSLKPGETPFRSVLVDKTKKDSVDDFSLNLIETCIQALDKFRVRYEHLSEQKLEDFRHVDLSIIESAIPTAMADRTRAVGVDRNGA